MNGQKGRYLRMNTNNPSTEQTYLKIANDGSIFQNLGKRIICGGWMRPTTYSVGNTFCPIIGTRNGPGNPIFTCPCTAAGPVSCCITPAER